MHISVPENLKEDPFGSLTQQSLTDLNAISSIQSKSLEQLTPVSAFGGSPALTLAAVQRKI